MMIRTLHPPKGAICLCAIVVTLAAPPSVNANANATYITVDPKGSQGTSVVGINSTGTVIGQYELSSNFAHGFVRAPDGKIESFDPPGSATTTPVGINAFGAIAGYYNDTSFVSHGFVRAGAAR